MAQTAVCISGALIFTTIQAQDFADVEGDAALGRKTFPIIAPRASRVASLLAMCAWSLGLALFWDVGPLVGGAFVALGSFVGARFFFLRTAEEDERSYVLYNVSRPLPPPAPGTSLRLTSTNIRILHLCATTRVSQIWLTLVHVMPNHARTGLFAL